MRSGISARQGPHQVAQKFRKTTLPCKAAMVRGLPSSAVSLNSGAGSGLRTKRMTDWLSCCGALCEPAKAGARKRNKVAGRWRERVMVSSIEEHIEGRAP